MLIWGIRPDTKYQIQYQYKVISLTYNTLQSSQPSYLRQLFVIQPPRSTRSSSTLTLLRPSVTSSLKFSNRSIAVSDPPLWNKLIEEYNIFIFRYLPALRQISGSPSELTQTSPLKISPRLFHSKLKTLLFGKSYPDLSSSSSLPPVSTPNTIHHSRLTVCLHDSLDLDRCISILFWLSAPPVNKLVPATSLLWAL